MSARSIAHVLFRRRRLMASVMVAALAAGAVLVAALPPRYRAEATLLAEAARPDSAAALAALFDSADLQRKVAARMGGRLYPHLPAEGHAAALARGLTIRPAPEAGLVRLSLDAASPDAAAQALAELMAEVRRRNATVFTPVGPAAEAARRELAELRRRLGVFDLAAERAALLERRAGLTSQASAARAEAAALGETVAVLQARLAATPKTIELSSQSERPEVIEAARAKLFELETREQELLGKYREESVFVQRVRDERRKVRQLLDQMMAASDTRVTQGANQVHQELTARLYRSEADLGSARARAKAAAGQLAETDRRLAELEAHAHRLAALEAEVAAADRAGAGRGAVEAIGIVQAAAAAARPLGPGPLGIMGLAVAGGLAIALLLAALAHHLSSRFSTPEDVERRLGLPVLTSIPRES